LHGNKQLTDSLRGKDTILALAKRAHGSLDKKELLLEVVETDAGVYLVPVCDLSLDWQLGVRSILNTFKTAVYPFIVQDVKQLLEQKAVAEVHSNVFDLPASSQCENPVEELSQVMSLLDNRSSLDKLEVLISHITDILQISFIKLVNIIIRSMILAVFLLLLLNLLLCVVGGLLLSTSVDLLGLKVLLVHGLVGCQSLSCTLVVESVWLNVTVYLALFGNAVSVLVLFDARACSSSGAIVVIVAFIHEALGRLLRHL